MRMMMVGALCVAWGAVGEIRPLTHATSQISLHTGKISLSSQEALNNGFFLEPRTLARDVPAAQTKLRMQTLVIIKLGFNQNYHTFTSMLPIKIVLWSEFP